MFVMILHIEPLEAFDHNKNLLMFVIVQWFLYQQTNKQYAKTTLCISGLLYSIPTILQSRSLFSELIDSQFLSKLDLQH